MSKIKKISVIGLGAIGSAYGSKLYDMDPDCVKVIADEKRIERYSKDGFYINGKKYNFNYVLPEEKGQVADLILVAVKFNDLERTIEDIRNHVGPNTIIMPLLNGISSEEIIGKAYGMNRMLYAACVAIDAVRVGNDIRFSSYGHIIFGEKTNEVYSHKVQAVKEIFDRSGICYEIPQNMLRSLWWKFMVNVGVNQASAVLKAPYGVFCEVGEAYDLMTSAMGEVINLSKKLDINLNEDDISAFEKVLRALSPQGKTSMLQDVEANRKTEVEMLAGTVCEMGRKYGVETPVNEALYRIIRSTEKMNNVK